MVRRDLHSLDGLDSILVQRRLCLAQRFLPDLDVDLEGTGSPLREIICFLSLMHHAYYVR